MLPWRVLPDEYFPSFLGSTFEEVDPTKLGGVLAEGVLPKGVLSKGRSQKWSAWTSTPLRTLTFWMWGVFPRRVLPGRVLPPAIPLFLATLAGLVLDVLTRTQKTTVM